MTAAKTSLQKFLMIALAIETAGCLITAPALAQSQASTSNSSSSTTSSTTSSSTSNSSSSANPISSSSTSNSSSSTSNSPSNAPSNGQTSSFQETASRNYNPNKVTESPYPTQSGSNEPPAAGPSSSGKITLSSDDDQSPAKGKKSTTPKSTYVRAYNKPEPTEVGSTAADVTPTPATNPTATGPMPPAPAAREAMAKIGTPSLVPPPAPLMALPATTANNAAKESNLPNTTPPVSAAIQPFIDQANKDMAAGRYEQAKHFLTDAIKRDPSCVQARRLIAYAMLKNNEPLEALQQLETVGKQMHPTPFDNSAMGEAYYILGDYEQAYDAYRIAVEATPEYDNARIGAIKSLTALNRIPDALKLCAAGAYQSKDKRMHEFYSKLYTETAAHRVANGG